MEVLITVPSAVVFSLKLLGDLLSLVGQSGSEPELGLHHSSQERGGVFSVLVALGGVGGFSDVIFPEAKAR